MKTNPTIEPSITTGKAYDASFALTQPSGAAFTVRGDEAYLLDLYHKYEKKFEREGVVRQSTKAQEAATEAADVPKLSAKHLLSVLAEKHAYRRSEKVKQRKIMQRYNELLAYDRANGTHYAVDFEKQIQRHNDMAFARKQNKELKTDPVMGFIQFDPTRNYQDEPGRWGVLNKKAK